MVSMGIEELVSNACARLDGILRGLAPTLTIALDRHDYIDIGWFVIETAWEKKPFDECREDEDEDRAKRLDLVFYIENSPCGAKIEEFCRASCELPPEAVVEEFNVVGLVAAWRIAIREEFAKVDHKRRVAAFETLARFAVSGGRVALPDFTVCDNWKLEPGVKAICVTGDDYDPFAEY